MNNYFRRKLRGIRATHTSVPTDEAEILNSDVLQFNCTSNKNLIDLQIYGNTTASTDSPTPESPSVISSVGDKTGNLLQINGRTAYSGSTWGGANKMPINLDNYYAGYYVNNNYYALSSEHYNVGAETVSMKTNAGGVSIAFPVRVSPNTAYTLALKVDTLNVGLGVGATWYQEDGTYISCVTAGADANGACVKSVTSPADAAYLLFSCRHSGSTKATDFMTFSEIRLVEGTYTAQTMPAYEPYGYKIPILLSGNNLMKVAGRTEQTIRGSGQSVKRILSDDKWAKLMANNNPSYPSNVVVGNDYVSFTVLTTNYGVALPVKLKPNTAYTVTANVDINNETSQMIIRVAFYSSDGTWLSQTAGVNRANSGSILANFTTPANAEMTSISFVKYLSESGITTPTLKASNIMLVEGTYTSSTMPQYEPYHAPTAYTVYLDEPLRKNGDNVDYISLKDGKAYRNNAEYNYKGNESILIFDNNKGFRYTIGNQKEGKALDGFCNRYKNYKSVGDATASQRVIFGASDSNTQMYIRKFNTDGSDTTVEDMQTALTGWYNGGNPLSVVYPTETQTAQTISLPSIATVNGTNIIKVGTAVTPTKIKAEFYV